MEYSKCTTGFVKIDRSVCHLYAVRPAQHSPSGAWQKISWAQALGFGKWGKKIDHTITLQDKYWAVVCSTTQRHKQGHFFPFKMLTKQQQPMLMRWTNPNPHNTQCNTGQSVWMVPQKFCYHYMSRNECREGGQWVYDGKFVGVGTCWKNQVDGGPQLRLSGRGSVSFLFSWKLLFSDPSVLTSQRTDARNAALKTASVPAGENWAKLATHNNQTRAHTQSHHAMA